MAQIRQNLAASIRVFTRCSSKAIKRLYAGPKREQGIYGGDTGHDPDSDDESHNAEHFKVDIDSLSDGPNETVFLIYLCVSTLLQGQGYIDRPAFCSRLKNSHGSCCIYWIHTPK